MRILFLTEEYPPLDGGCGGIASYVASISPMLAQRGHEVHVLSCRSGQEDQDDCEQGVYVHRRGYTRLPGFWRIARVLKVPNFLRAIEQGISNFRAYLRLGIQFDVIEYPDTNTEGWCFALFHRTPLIAHLHLPIPIWYPFEGNPNHQRDYRWTARLEKFSVARADLVTSPSSYQVDRLKELGWLNRVEVEVIPQFLQLGHWHDTPSIRQTQPIVLFLGWLGKIKAPEVLVHAMKIVRKIIPEARAVFVGGSVSQRDGLPYNEWLQKLAGEDHACEFVGYVPYHEVITYISMSRVMALPSWFDNSPISAWECMASGRPVVISATTGIAKLVKQNGAGTVIPPGDPGALAEALLPYLSEVVYAAEVGARARETTQANLDPVTVVSQREKAYQRTIQSFKRTPWSKSRRIVDGYSGVETYRLGQKP